MAACPIMVPSETLRPAATRAGEARGGRIQVGATPRGSIVVTVKRPRRFPVWHRPRLVGSKASLAYDAEASRPADLLTCRELDL
jgi:hypothetical protein